MSLPAAWVDSLMARLAVRYGAAFMRQYEGIDVSLVRADWADVLGGFCGRPDAIRYALDHLPPDRPVTALQFRAICNAAPDTTLALPAPDVPAQPERVAQIAAKLNARRSTAATPAEQCYANIMRIAAARDGKLSAAQRHQIAAMRAACLIPEAA